MEILYILLVLLVITRLFGELAVRVGQPPLVGELIAGILLGIFVREYAGAFPVLSELGHNEVFTAITDLGIFFLMLMGGIEMKPGELLESSKGALVMALSAMALPLLLGGILGWFFVPASEYRIAQTMLLGTALAITAVPVAIRVLMDLDKLDSRFGRFIISAAVFDDIISLVLLAVLTALIRTGGFPGIETLGLLLGKMILFLIIVGLAGTYLFPVLGRFVKRFNLDELELSFLLIVAFAFAVLAEALDMHFILGAFAAGLFFQRQTVEKKVYDDVKNKISGITMGFLAPVFFASIGLHLDLSAFTAVPLFLGLFVFVAFFSKLAGAMVPSLFFGFESRAAFAIGIAMSARGAVELIIADIALRAGLFSHPDPPPPLVEHMFSVIVITAIVTTIAVPVALRFVVRAEGKQEG